MSYWQQHRAATCAGSVPGVEDGRRLPMLVILSMPPGWYLSNLVNLPSDWLKLSIDAVPGDDNAEEDEDEDEDDDEARDRDEEDGDETVGGQVNAARPEASGFLFDRSHLFGGSLQPVEGISCPTKSPNLSRIHHTYSFVAVKDSAGHHVPPSGARQPGFLDLPFQWFAECTATITDVAKQNQPTTHLSCWRSSVKASQDASFQGRKNPKAGRLALPLLGQGRDAVASSSNMNQLRNSIDIAALPTSYGGAIMVCRQFGFRYIWINSLCIIQDSREDWQREALTMKEVYQNSVLNVTAAEAEESSDASFLSRDAGFIRPVQVDAEWDDIAGLQPRYYLFDEEPLKDDMEDSSLRRRA
ncbi:hypothetical protein N657DRAFT_700609 [Parathielavia appendiculata]|uniref:Heterokaryon incompatibility domain-containing protein n=1 Tax=Parathielavia appendiculata TaxID=2587402 RepID=A0AAN6TV97_9PEZI|nr:hypothetical protein N657DRAFT_700609 [Parathielavia appendiculata]